MEMEIIAIAASSGTIRELAKFFNDVASEMEELGTDYDHTHLMDAWSDWEDGLPDIQIVNEKYM